MLEVPATENPPEDGTQSMEELMAHYGQTMVEPGRNFHFDMGSLPYAEGRGNATFCEALETLRDFINLPLITDEIPYEERLAFRKEIKRTNWSYFKFLDENKIRWNQLGNVQPALEFVHDYVKDTNLPESTKLKIKALAASCPKMDAPSYLLLTLDQQIALLHNYERIIMDIFETLMPERTQ